MLGVKLGVHFLVPSHPPFARENLRVSLRSSSRRTLELSFAAGPPGSSHSFHVPLAVDHLNIELRCRSPFSKSGSFLVGAASVPLPLDEIQIQRAGQAQSSSLSPESPLRDFAIGSSGIVLRMSFTFFPDLTDLDAATPNLQLPSSRFQGGRTEPPRTAAGARPMASPSGSNASVRGSGVPESVVGPGSVPSSSADSRGATAGGDESGSDSDSADHDRGDWPSSSVTEDSGAGEPKPPVTSMGRPLTPLGAAADRSDHSRTESESTSEPEPDDDLQAHMDAEEDEALRAFGVESPKDVDAQTRRVRVQWLNFNIS